MLSSQTGSKQMNPGKLSSELQHHHPCNLLMWTLKRTVNLQRAQMPQAVCWGPDVKGHLMHNLATQAASERTAGFDALGWERIGSSQSQWLSKSHTYMFLWTENKMYTQVIHGSRSFDERIFFKNKLRQMSRVPLQFSYWKFLKCNF